MPNLYTFPFIMEISENVGGLSLEAYGLHINVAIVSFPDLLISFP